MASSALVEALLSPKVTFNQFVVEGQQHQEGATGHFTALLTDIATACKTISMLVNKGPKLGVLGVADTQNVQGEEQKTLDVMSNDVFISANNWRGHVGGMVSEENDEFIPIPAKFQRGKYLLTFDPLDGSSNIGVNVSVGTIFSILRAPDSDKELTAEDFLQPGTKQVAAGYCLYGPQTTLVFSKGEGVNGFTLDHDVGEFILSYPNMKVPETTKEYCINQANRKFWDPPVLKYVEECEAGKDGPRGKDFTMRYVGSMVADVHRILLRGGIFLYPLDAKLRKEGKNGRLRLLYEVNPMAFLMEDAGGASTAGAFGVLDYQPKDIHERLSCIIGSKEEVELVKKYHNEWVAAGSPPQPKK